MSLQIIIATIIIIVTATTTIIIRASLSFEMTSSSLIILKGGDSEGYRKHSWRSDIQESPRTLSMRKMKKTTPKHIIIKLFKTHDKNKNLKNSWVIGGKDIYRGTKDSSRFFIKNNVRVSSITEQFLQIMKRKTLPTQIYTRLLCNKECDGFCLSSWEGAS